MFRGSDPRSHTVFAGVSGWRDLTSVSSVTAEVVLLVTLLTSVLTLSPLHSPHSVFTHLSSTNCSHLFSFSVPLPLLFIPFYFWPPITRFFFALLLLLYFHSCFNIHVHTHTHTSIQTHTFKHTFSFTSLILAHTRARWRTRVCSCPAVFAETRAVELSPHLGCLGSDLWVSLLLKFSFESTSDDAPPGASALTEEAHPGAVWSQPKWHRVRLSLHTPNLPVWPA